MYIYIFVSVIFIYFYVCTFTYIHTYMFTRTYIYLYIRVQMQIHIYMHSNAFVYNDICINLSICLEYMCVSTLICISYNNRKISGRSSETPKPGYHPSCARAGDRIFFCIYILTHACTHVHTKEILTLAKR